MGDDHNGHAVLAALLLQKRQDLLAGVIVQRTGGLIAQQQLGPLGQGPGDGNALLLAAGELGREIYHALTQPHVLQDLRRRQRVLDDL